MAFTLEFNDLFIIIDRATEYGSNRALEKCCKISPYMTKEECRIAGGKREVGRALKLGSIKTVLKGKRTYVLRESFDKWILKDELASNT